MNTDDESEKHGTLKEETLKEEAATAALVINIDGIDVPYDVVGEQPYYLVWSPDGKTNPSRLFTNEERADQAARQMASLNKNGQVFVTVRITSWSQWQTAEEGRRSRVHIHHHFHCDHIEHKEQTRLAAKERKHLRKESRKALEETNSAPHEQTVENQSVPCEPKPVRHEMEVTRAQTLHAGPLKDGPVKDGPVDLKSNAATKAGQIGKEDLAHALIEIGA